MEITLLSLSLVVLTYLLLQLEEKQTLPDFIWSPYVSFIRITGISLGLGFGAALLLTTCLHTGTPPPSAWTFTLSPTAINLSRKLQYYGSLALFLLQLFSIAIGMLRLIIYTLRQLPDSKKLDQLMKDLD